MADWAAGGFPIDQFWQQTPRSFSAWMKGAAERVTVERETAIFAAWFSANWSRSEKMPDLDKALEMVRPKPPKPPATPEQIRDTMRLWVAATGGTLMEG